MKFKQKDTKLENNIIIYDLETCSRNPYFTDPIEISAICADINTLELKQNSDGEVLIFTSLIKPPKDAIIQETALQKNNINLEMLEDAPEQEFVFKQFCSFCRQFQRTSRKWHACYSAGYNISSFDNIIMERLSTRYEYTNKDGDSLLFHPFHSFDLAYIIRMWFYNSNELTDYSMDGIRDYFGISGEGSHRAEKDVIDTWIILRKFMEFYKELAGRHMRKFKKVFSSVQ